MGRRSGVTPSDAVRGDGAALVSPRLRGPADTGQVPALGLATAVVMQ